MRNGIFLFFSFYISFTAAAAALPALPESYKECASVYPALLEQLGSKNEWIRQVDPQPDSKLFRSPTEKIGQWVEMHFQDGGKTHLRFFSPTEVKEFVAVGTSCKIQETKAERPGYLKSAMGKKNFTDKDLEKVLASKQKTLIYVWSPRMVYSLEFLGTFRKVAAKKGFQFIAVMDPNVPLTMAKLAAAKARISLRQDRMLASVDKKFQDASIHLASVELSMRNGMIHYPTSFVVANGKISNFRILGVKTEDFILQNLNKAMEQL